MAQSKTRNFFVWIIMGLLFVGLMGFGATGLSGTVRTVGEVGEKPMTAQAYFNGLRTQIQIRSAQLGRQISFPEAEAERLPERALGQLIGQRALDNEAAMLGLSVGDAVVSEQVLATPAFRGIDGGFDREAYRETLARQNLSVREFETSVREETARALLQAAVFTGIPDAATFGQTFATFAREGRTFTWAPLMAEDIEIALPEPSDADLQAHYDANPDLYTSPEIRVVSYAWLTPEMIQDDVPVSEEELREEYEARIAEYVIPERRLVERLVFGDEETATAALAAIEAGETDFPALVEERGLSLDDVDIGDVSEAEMGEAGPAIFALENGGVTGPFPTDLGPALYRMNAVLAARNTSFEEALPELREDQAAARARRVIDDQQDAINDLLAGGASMSDLAAQTDMQADTIEWSEEVSTGIAAYAAFREAAAATSPDDFPELLQLDDGGLFAIEVVEIRAPALIPLEDIRGEVIAGWEAEETAKAVLAEAEARQAQLLEGVDFAGAGLDAVQEVGLTQRGFVNGTPPTFLQTVFDMEPGAIEVLPHDGGAIIVRLDEIVAADETDEVFATERDALAESASEGIAQDIYELYTRSVQVRTDVYVNEQAINAVHSNFR